MSSFSSDLKLELMVTGQNAGTWGDKTNTNLNLVQQAIAGVESVTLSDGGTVALVMSNAALSNARNMVIKFATITLSSASIVTIPDSIEKFYIFDATAVTAATNLTIKTASGSGFTLDASKIYAAYSDGTNLKEVSLDTLGGTVAAAQIASDAVTTAKILQSNVTQNKMAPNSVGTAQILQSNVTQNKMAPNAVGTAQILQSNVTLNKMAPNSVGPAQLQSTAVTAGSYNTADITVDEDGRITAAATGSAGSPDFALTFADATAGSATFNAQPGTTKLNIYMTGGGGGGGSGAPTHGCGQGGNAGIGFFNIPVSSPAPSPFSAPYTIGDGGNGGTATGSGQTGQSSTFGSPVQATCTGGGGGQFEPAGPTGSKSILGGSSGTAPGATLDLTVATGNPTNGGTQLPISAPIDQVRRGAAGFVGRNPLGDGSNSSTTDKFGTGGQRDRATPSPTAAGKKGNAGAIVIFENIVS